MLKQHPNRRIPRKALPCTVRATRRGPSHGFVLNNSLIPRWFLIFSLVLRAVNVPTIKKYRFLKRKLFVTLSSPETTTAKTADVPVERHMANWNQNLDPLHVFLLPSNFMPKTSIQSCTTVFTPHTSSFCEAVCTFRHHFRDP